MPMTSRRSLGVWALLGGMCLLVYGCVPTGRSVVGTYAPNDDTDPATLVLKSDGTFLQMDQGEEIGAGRWKLESAYHVFKSLELDGKFRLLSPTEDANPARHSQSYGLVHKGGKLCLDVDQVLLVWCKVS